MEAAALLGLVSSGHGATRQPPNGDRAAALGVLHQHSGSHCCSCLFFLKNQELPSIHWPSSLMLVFCKFWCACACVCAWVCACVHAYVHACVHTGYRQPWLPQESSTLLFETRVSHWPQTHLITRIAGPQASRTCLFLPAQYWGYKFVPPCLASLSWLLGGYIWLLMLVKQSLHWLSYISQPVYI